MRESLYKYSDEELSLRVFNEYHLYQIRHNKGFIRHLNSIYQYTNKQLAVLKADLQGDLIELATWKENKGVA